LPSEKDGGRTQRLKEGCIACGDQFFSEDRIFWLEESKVMLVDDIHRTHTSKGERPIHARCLL